MAKVKNLLRCKRFREQHLFHAVLFEVSVLFLLIQYLTRYKRSYCILRLDDAGRKNYVFSHPHSGKHDKQIYIVSENELESTIDRAKPVTRSHLVGFVE